jgi:hypothetical protein
VRGLGADRACIDAASPRKAKPIPGACGTDLRAKLAALSAQAKTVLSAL